MPAQIRPNRLEVNDRFPMLGFTIRTHGEPRRAEIAVATDPALFTPGGKGKRGQSNFYSSRGVGPLSAPRGEAVFVLPPEVLARFVGSEKLYFGLATAPAGGSGGFDIDVMPTAASPYVSLRALTGRSLRRIRAIPGRARGPGAGELDWAGDNAQPGQQPAQRSATASTTVAPPPPPAHYDDGFGPMPTPKADTPPAPPAASAGAPFAAQGLSNTRAFDAGDDDGPGIEVPLGDNETPQAAQMAVARALTATAEYDRASPFAAATGFRA